ncbi:DegT/DnrJ/EryC1/StrS family aminotransferase [Chloroflexota bacterium]
MAKLNIPLFKIYWDNDDIDQVTKAIRSGANWAIGPSVQEFESRIARYVGMDYAVAFNSGTSALHAVMAAFDIGNGDEVIVPSFTFIATANAALFVGAKPVFADIEESTNGLDPKDVERRITPKTRAIIPVHYGGCPCFVEELRQIAQQHNLLLIEDAAESLGASIGGKKVGSFGDLAMFSFCANKVITTGEGGAVVTNSGEIYERLKLIRSHGRADTADYFSTSEYLEYISLGYNFRMSNITASLGISQIEKVEKIINRRRRNSEYLTQRLSQVEGIILPYVPENFLHIYQMYTIKVNGGGKQRNDLIKYLSQHGIMTKVYFYPVHLSHFYRNKFGFNGGELPVTEKIAGQVLTLPMYPSLTKDEIDYIADKVAAFFS